MKKIKKSLIVFGTATILMLMVTSIPATSPDTVVNKENKEELLTDLPYNIDINTMTMKELEELVYTELLKTNSISSETTEDIDLVFEVLNDIGVEPEMTVANAKNVIETNKEYIKTHLNFKKINFMCDVKIELQYFLLAGNVGWIEFPSGYIPYVHWAFHGFDSIWEYCDVYIDGLLGLQKIHNPNIKVSGSLFIFNGSIGSQYDPIQCTYDGWIDGYALISISNVPFVKETTQIQTINQQLLTNQQQSTQILESSTTTQESQNINS